MYYFWPTNNIWINNDVPNETCQRKDLSSSLDYWPVYLYNGPVKYLFIRHKKFRFLAVLAFTKDFN